jgi:hypothetical protein
LTIGVAAANAQKTTESYRITDGRITVVCTLTEGGSFEARTTAVSGGLTPVNGSRAFSGVVATDLATLETGIGLRDRHMKEIYLETGRGASFSTAQVESIRIDQPEGRGSFDALLTLHGEQHPISGIVELRSRHDGTVAVRAHFPISLTAFHIRPPRYLGVGIQDQVQAQVAFVVVPASDGRKAQAR